MPSWPGREHFRTHRPLSGNKPESNHLNETQPSSSSRLNIPLHLPPTAPPQTRANPFPFPRAKRHEIRDRNLRASGYSGIFSLSPPLIPRSSSAFIFIYILRRGRLPNIPVSRDQRGFTGSCTSSDHTHLFLHRFFALGRCIARRFARPAAVVHADAVMVMVMVVLVIVGFLLSLSSRSCQQSQEDALEGRVQELVVRERRPVHLFLFAEEERALL